MTNTLVTLLDTSTPLEVIGDDMQAVMQDILNFLVVSGRPVDLVGPPGSGKSHIGKAVAIEYARLRNTTAFSTVHDMDTTKTSAIAGFRMVAGSSVVVPGTVATAMQDDGVVFVDEFTHGLEGVQGGYNTITDQDSRTSAGDVTFHAGKNFRLITAHNTTRYAGNQSLIPSFASRLVTWYFEYPSASTESRIAYNIALQDIQFNTGREKLIVPNAIIRYLVSYMRSIRESYPNLGLSARNVAAAVLLLEITSRRDIVTNDQIDPYFLGTSNEAVKRQVAERVLWKETNTLTASDLREASVMLALRFVTSVGVETFRNRLKQAFMYHLDVKGGTLSTDKAMRETMARNAI